MTDGSYRDRNLTIDNHTLTIRHYYFPWAGAKRVALSSVRGVQLAPLSVFGGRGRLWGTSTTRYWANLDTRRPRKDVGFALDLGHHVRPFVTPDYPQAFEDALRTDLPDTPFDAAAGPRVV